MQVGSLVECVHECTNDQTDYVIPIIVREIYTIRWIGTGQCKVTGRLEKAVRLEEIINNTSKDGLEYVYRASYFKEIQSPMSISIDEIIKEPEIIQV